MPKIVLTKDSRDTWMYGFLGILIFLFLWHIACLFTNFGKIFPTPVFSFKAFFSAFINPIGKYTLLGHILVSLKRVLVGYILSSLTGILIGLAMGHSKMAHAIIYPLFSIIRPIPGIAWIPLAILWIGIGEPTIYFIIFMGGFSQMVMNTMDGAQACQQGTDRGSQSAGGQRKPDIQKNCTSLQRPLYFYRSADLSFHKLDGRSGCRNDYRKRRSRMADPGRNADGKN